MFVRLFVDENLDRMVPISKQPKEKIQAIIDSCTRQFPEFAERARKRIRTYLKSCRRNKRARDPNSPWDAVSGGGGGRVRIQFVFVRADETDTGPPHFGSSGTDPGNRLREREPQRKADETRTGTRQSAYAFITWCPCKFSHFICASLGPEVLAIFCSLSIDRLKLYQLQIHLVGT